jgi:hypothetical protein
MNDHLLHQIRDLIQEDVNGRGLRADPRDNLLTATAGDFQAACRSLAEAAAARVAVVTGFFIPHGEPPGGETDGPPGALFLARALTPLGIEVVLATDDFGTTALKAGLEACGLEGRVVLITLPPPEAALSPAEYQKHFMAAAGPITHLVALERAGPSHTPESVRSQPRATPAAGDRFLREVAPQYHGRCLTMRGRDITPHMSPVHFLWEGEKAPFTTIGIGDGGNEIGMGKIAWDVIRRNIPNGGQVACRVAADYLVVCGVSNWGAYGLAAGVRLLKGRPLDDELFDVERERRLLEIMVERGPLVDGVTGKPSVSVDGLSFENYAQPLWRMGMIG